MEGRIPHNDSTGRQTYDVHDNSSINDGPNSDLQLLPLPPPPGFRETYVIQIPKDHVYWVPPPGHALIAEQRRDSIKVKKTPCRSRGCIIAISVVLGILLLIGLTFSILHLIFRPKGPSFSISNVLVKHPKSGPPRYVVSVKAKNPNSQQKLLYENGDVLLGFSNKMIANGKFPSSTQKQEESTTMKVVLHGTEDSLPRQVEHSLHKESAPVSLDLETKFPVRMKLWILMSWAFKAEVECKFKVNSLANNTRIMSENCDTKLNS